MSHLKKVFGLNVIRRTTFRPWSRVCLRLPLHRAHPQLQHHYHRKVQVQHLFQYRLMVREQMSTNGETRINTQPRNSKTNKIEDHAHERSDPSYSEIPEWLQEFLNSHGARVPVLSDSHASSSHEPSLEPLRRVVSGNHSIFTHFRNFEICQRPTLQERRAEDALAEPYFVQQILVI